MTNEEHNAVVELCKARVIRKLEQMKKQSNIGAEQLIDIMTAVLDHVKLPDDFKKTIPLLPSKWEDIADMYGWKR